MRSALLKHRFFTILLVLLTLTGLFAGMFHHHTDGDHHHDCAVCRLITALSGLLLFAAMVLIHRPVKTQSFTFVFQETFQSLLSVSSLKDRAPPAFSC